MTRNLSNSKVKCEFINDIDHFFICQQGSNFLQSDYPKPNPMCGRFTLQNPEQLSEKYDVSNTSPFEPKFNIAPGMRIPTIIWNNGKMKLQFMTWEFRSQTPGKPDFTLINTKGETLGQKPMFKKLIQTQRCLIPSSGFYEWLKTDSQKIPHYIFLKDQNLFSMTGLYRTKTSDSGEIEHSCVIITIESNQFMSSIHNRMPLIIAKDDEKTWLDPTTPEQDILNLIKPYSSEQMGAYPVSKKVNFAGNDSPDLIKEFHYEL